jgi:hypothetical protein
MLSSRTLRLSVYGDSRSAVRSCPTAAATASTTSSINLQQQQQQQQQCKSFQQQVVLPAW